MSMEPEQICMLHPMRPEPTTIAQLAELGKRPKLDQEDYWWPTGQPSEERKADELAKELQAVSQLQKMARFGITGRDKVIFYFSILHCILEDQENLDKPITWAEFRRFFNCKLAAYCENRDRHD